MCIVFVLLTKLHNYREKVVKINFVFNLVTYTTVSGLTRLTTISICSYSMYVILLSSITV